mmetsp:Transcript_40781/g.93902  ORF Transcript_40781/g.93902 Transcript_40781/m.93902 type:complete len:1076 (-) Transcript_40781:104-3331(-)
MVIAEAVAGVVGGVKSLFDYNRSNYMYDRKMRQDTEFKILEYRNLQSGLWREDVQDLVGLTERKMDSYLIVNTLQLSMCVMLFAEGRLEPGTPPWLLHLYMLTLAGAFMYLLMSVWLAMHASIVAQVSAVRLLTQFVRLPVPKWEQLQAMRTYGVTYEKLDVKKVMRVPFLSAPPVLEEGEEGDDALSGASATAGTPLRRATSSTAVPRGAASVTGESVTSAATRGDRPDPWGLEMNGRAPYELQQRPIRELRHINLVRHEAVNYQSHDAFARVAMSFGTNQLLFAICYYTLGYVNVMDAAPYGAIAVAVIMVGIAVALVQLDLSLTAQEQMAAQLLIVAGPMFATVATCMWDFHTSYCERFAMIVLPFAFLSHGCWLLWSLGACQAEVQPNGAILPMKFTAVLNLDVFGWFRSTSSEAISHVPSGYEPLRSDSSLPAGCGHGNSQDQLVAKEHSKHLQADLALWESEDAQRVMSEEDRRRVSRLARKFKDAIEEEYNAALPHALSPSTASSSKVAPLELPPPPAKWLKLKSDREHGRAEPRLYEAGTGRVCSASEAGAAGVQMGSPLVRSLTDMEESVESFCDTTRSNRAILEYRQTQPERKPQRAATLPTTLLPGLTTVCEEPHSFDVAEEDLHLEAEHGRFVQDSLLEERLGLGFEEEHGSGSESEHGGPEEVHSKGGSDDLAQDSADEVEQSPQKHQGRVPWRLFKSATLLLIVLWACGVALSTLVALDWITLPTRSWDDKALRDVRDVRNSRSLLDNPALPFLPEGQLIEAQWPRESSFVPRAMSCDRSGRRLAVADDFGVYAAEFSGDPAPDQLTRVHQDRRLRAQQPETSHPMATFTRVQPCTAFEGQTLKDIGVVCSKDTANCRVLVLHGHGQNLTECPLDVEGFSDGSTVEAARANLTWRISKDWLQAQEHVELVSVNPECLRDDGTYGAPHLDSDVQACFVVAVTSTGRMVQLRRHLENKDELVPDWSMRRESREEQPQSLHVVLGSVLVLWPRSKSVQALSGQTGGVIGEWRLPPHYNWMAFAGGRSNFFLLGQNKTGASSLWRFPVPEALSDWANGFKQRSEI